MNILEEIAAKTTEADFGREKKRFLCPPSAPLRSTGGPEPQNFSLRKL